VYDGVDLALAETLDDRIVTADRRFHAAAVASEHGRVELLGRVDA
jgi:predicted nucleic acid-binding protein